MFSLFKKSDSFWPVFAWQDCAVLGGGLAVFLGLAISTVDKFSIWFDEAFGSYMVRFSFWNLTRYTASDVHPPLYYWLLKLWTMLFGNTEVGIRSMSIFFGALAVILAFMLTLRLFGRRAAYISLVFLVLSPIFIRYSQEGRMYTLLTVEVLAATYVLVYAHEHAKKRWTWITYGILVAAGMLTQYFAALAWLTHWVWRVLMVRSKGDSWQQIKKKLLTREWVTAHIVAVGLFLPWLPWLVIQFALVQGHGFWIQPVTSATVPDFLTDFLLFVDHDGTSSWLALGFYVLLIGVGYLVWRLLRTFKDEQKKYYILLVCMVVVPIGLLFVASMPPLRSAFVDRYVIATSIIFLPILIGVSLAFAPGLMWRRISMALGMIVVIMMVIGIYNQSIIGNYNKTSKQSNNTRQLLEAVRARSAPGTPIIGSTPWIFYEAAIYNLPDSPIYFVDETTKYQYGSLTMLVENDDFKIKDLDAFDAAHPSIWMIANLKDGAPSPLRASWKTTDTITIDDDVSHQPLFKAVRYTTH